MLEGDPASRQGGDPASRHGGDPAGDRHGADPADGGKGGRRAPSELEALSRLWPLFGLVVRTPIIELRYPTDRDLAELADLAAKGVHDPGTMPFRAPWTDAASPLLERNALAWHWTMRGSWSVGDWHLPMAVWRDGALAGTQELFAKDFPITRTVSTGSWLGKAFQGQGTGAEMRAAILHLAFAGLGAACATTSAFEDNAASASVSAKVGYADDGVDTVVRRGAPARLRRFRLEREDWSVRRRADIAIGGLAACAPMFGVDVTDDALPS